MNTGNVKQVAAFEKLLGFCNAHGILFNPSKVSIQSNSLNALLASAQASLVNVKTAQTEYENAVNTRNDAFDELPKFMTRIVNALAATDATPATIKDAYTYVKRSRAPVKKSGAAPSSNGSAEPKPTRSTSQLDYDSRTDNFEALVKVVSLEPTYAPNEADLSVAPLQAHVVYLRQLNTNVIQTLVALSNVRAARNKFLYREIYKAGRAVKRYVKGVFGYQSVAYQQIRGLKFIERKIT